MRKMSEKYRGKIYDFIDFLLKNHIYCQQTELVIRLIIDGDDPSPSFDHAAYITSKYLSKDLDKVKEWLLITESLGDLLEKAGEMIDGCDGCVWWGRLSSDDLHDEEVFREIYKYRTVKLYKRDK